MAKGKRLKVAVLESQISNRIDTHMHARLKSDEKDVLWSIQSITEGGIALSGPEPCRGYKVVDLDTFDKDWHVIWCHSPNLQFENERSHMVYCRQGQKMNVICAFCHRDRNFNYEGNLKTE